MEFLPFTFYARDTGDVARSLLGKILVRRIGRQTVKCRLVETEAYYGKDDPASHAARGKTKRTAVMFGQPGHAYVYFNYGVHHLLNVVTEVAGTAGAVLVRAVEPIEGMDMLLRNRPVSQVRQLTNGPGKLTQALGINLDLNGKSLDTSVLGIIDSEENNFRVVSGPRIGISAGRDMELRFCIENNKFVSRRLNREWP